MGEHSAIEWCHDTFNPVIGCQKVSAACDNCYAETLMDTRYGRVEWGPNGKRVRTSPDNWKQPLRWNRQAKADGTRPRVFCASLSDVFDNKWPIGAREDLFELIRETPHLVWLLLTKRPQNMAAMLPADWGKGGWPNVWLGTSAEDEERYRQRWHHVAATPAVVRFLSYEPGLGPIGDLDLGRVGAPNWVIVGGESGPGARTFNAEWARRIRDHCAAAGVALFIKQLGAACVDEMYGISGAALRVDPDVAHLITRLKDRKGGDMSEWPTDLRIREFPDAE